MRFFITDLKRAFTEPYFYLSTAITFLLLFIGMIFSFDGGEKGQLFLYSQAFVLPFAAPLLASMPYSVMLMREKETGYKTLIAVKSGHNGYELRRFFVCGISGAAALFIPQLIFFLICSLVDAAENTGENLLTILLSFPFGFSYSVFSYSLTFMNKKKYVPLVMPEVIYLLFTYAFPYMGLSEYYPPLDISPSIYGGEISVDRLIIPVILIAVGLLMTVLGKQVNKDE